MADGCTLVAVRALLAFSDPVWKLPVHVPAWRRALLEWRLSSRSIDSGLPRVVAELLCEALVSQGNVTFAVGIAEPWGSALVARRWQEDRHYRTVTTRDAKAAVELFDAALFSWSLQAQAAYVTRADAPPPRLTVDHFSVQDEARMTDLADLGVRAVLFPGVDGDVAGLYATSESVEAAVLQTLSAGVRRLGADWAVTSEEGTP